MHKNGLLLFILLFLSSCAPRLTPCGLDYPNGKAYCSPSWGASGYTLSLIQIEKYTCFSPADFSDLLRGVTGNITVCAIVDATQNQAYCSKNGSGKDTTVSALNQYFCLSSADLATYERWFLANHG